MIEILLRLLFAHIIADFFLQTDKLCEMKKAKPSVGLPIHSLIHAACSYIIVGEWTNVMVPAVIFVSHLAIDWTKIRYMQDGVKGFLLDQTLHLIIILALSFSCATSLPPSALAIASQVLTSQYLRCYYVVIC